MIGSYEEGRAVPKLQALQTMSHYFDVSIDDLINADLQSGKNISGDGHTRDISGKGLRVLTTLVDRDNNELITLVPVKASAGYTAGYADPDFIETLPKFSLPLPELGRERTCRAFQITGNSMEPVPSGSYIICEYLQNWTEIKEGRAYILVTYDDGVVYKRIFHRITSYNVCYTKLLRTVNQKLKIVVHIAPAFSFAAYFFVKFHIVCIKDIKIDG